MRSGWVSATAAVLLTAGWAAAQAPAPSAIDHSGYSSAEAKPVPPAPGRPRAAATEAPAIQQTSAAPDLFPAPVAPAGVVVEEHPAGPAAPPSGYALVDRPDNWPPPYRVWASGDFLVWKLRNAPLPSLVSTVPIGVIRANSLENGVTITNFTTVSITSTPAVGLGSLDSGEQFGGRFTAGVWLDPEERIGLEATGLFISSRNVGFGSSTGNNVDQFLINFPFSSTFVATPGSGALTFPTFVVRQATANLAGTGSTGLWGAELNARCTSPALGAVSGLVGFRYLDFHETLNVANSVHLFRPAGFEDVNGAGLPLDTNFPADLTYNTTDMIRTHNHFYGGQVGLDLDMYVGRFTVDFLAKAALGVMHQTADVLGNNITTGTGTASDGVLMPGGLLSSPLDQGSHSRNKIAFVPEINVKLGYQLLPGLRVYVGYDFLYLSSVIRPGNEVGLTGTNLQATVAGTTQTIKVSQPAYSYKDTDLSINGINFGLELRY